MTINNALYPITCQVFHINKACQFINDCLSEVIIALSPELEKRAFLPVDSRIPDNLKFIPQLVPETHIIIKREGKYAGATFSGDRFLLDIDESTTLLFMLDYDFALIPDTFVCPKRNFKKVVTANALLIKEFEDRVILDVMIELFI